MHPCLRVDEILRVIAAHVYSSSLWPDHLTDLCSMALTCHTFCEPALEERWRRVTDIDRLAHCLPDELLEVVPRPRAEFFVTIKKVTLPHQWNRVQYYARFVREFSMTGSWSSLLRLENTYPTYNVFAQHYPKPQLFPRLEDFLCLEGAVDFKRNRGFLELLIPNGYPVRCVRTGGEYRGLDGLLEVVRTRTPQLKELDLVTFRPQGAALMPRWLSPPWMSRFIRSLTGLTRLNINTPFDTEAMQHIARLPHLTSLNAFFLDDNFPPLSVSPSNRTPAVFMALEHLVIFAKKPHNHAERLLGWLESIGTPPRLLSCVINSVSIALPSQFHALATTISRFTTLTRLELRLAVDDETGICSAGEDALYPLLDGLRRIERFRLEPNGIHIDLTPSFLVKMASAWPKLRRVRMLPWPESPHLKAHDLLAFAAYCPQLVELELPVPLELPAIFKFKLDETILRKLGRYDPSKSTVTSISFSDDPKRFPRTTQFLARFFPRTKFVEY